MLPLFILAINNSEDQDFAGMLYLEHRDKIYKTAYNILKDEQDAEDVTMETFVRLIDNLETYRYKNQDELTGIIITISKNIAFDIYRKKRKMPFLPLLDNDREEFSEELTFEIEDFIIKQDLYERLLSAIDELTPEYMQIVKFKVVYEYSYKQISDMLNISEGNVRIRYMRGRKMLNEYIQGKT